METLQVQLVNAKLSSTRALTAIQQARQSLSVINRQIDSAYNKSDYGRIAWLECKKIALNKTLTI